MWTLKTWAFKGKLKCRPPAAFKEKGNGGHDGALGNAATPRAGAPLAATKQHTPGPGRLGRWAALTVKCKPMSKTPAALK